MEYTLDFLQSSEKKRNTSKKVFSILLKKDDDKFQHLGTGFFIGTEGLFFTAGHVFRKMCIDDIHGKDFNNYYIGFPQSDDNKLHKIKYLWYESFGVSEQKGYTYRDTAVGVVDYKNDSYYVFKRKRPKLNEILTLEGYCKTGLSTQQVYEVDIDYTDDLALKTLSYNPLISHIDEDYNKKPEEVDKNKFYNNCILLEGKTIKTQSGSPIVDSNGFVVGILIGGIKEYSTMLLAKYCAKTIRYRTYYRYDMYEDIK